jgi:hypothetical protein
MEHFYSINLRKKFTETKEGTVYNPRRLYEDQRAIMVDILSENSKKEYPKSFTELLRLEQKRFVQGVCYFINKILKFI